VKEAPRKVTILQTQGTTWVKEDNTPNLGPFTGNPGVKQILSDPTKVINNRTFFWRQLV
jgi:hypothetical protein